MSDWLDPTLVRRRRHQLGLTKLQLARLAAVDITTVEHAEQDGATIYNSATLQLSNQLGIDLANADQRTATPAHVEILGAILADLREPVQAQAIAATLDWSVEHVLAVANHLRRKLQRLGQTVTRSASDHLSLAAHPANLADHQREQIRAEVLTIDQTTASVVLRVIEERRRDRYCGALNPEQQHAATELIAAGAITTSHDLLSPSERLENAIDNRHLTELRW
jgi:transcriptional regulator with XRE-family HTH domain